jgi:hypothetical protein
MGDQSLAYSSEIWPEGNARLSVQSYLPWRVTFWHSNNLYHRLLVAQIISSRKSLAALLSTKGSLLGLINLRSLESSDLLSGIGLRLISLAE